MYNDTPKSVLITGGAKRIGRALALSFAEAGWDVGVHYRSSETEAQDLVEQIQNIGRRAALLPADLSQQSEVEDLIKQCTREIGSPQCLINNASRFEPDRLNDLEPISYALHMDVNLRAPLFLSKAFAAQLKEGQEGVIINIIDQRVLNLKPSFFSYTLSKAALWTATQTMAQQLAPSIRVNAISPGPVLRSVHQTEQQFAREAENTLLGKGTSLGDICAAAHMILNTSSLTGQMITLDGGQHLTR